MFNLRYTFQAFQKDHFWLPPAIMGLFLILVYLIPESNWYNTGRSFIGFLLPLLSGGLAAYGFLEDSALELQFTVKRKPWRMILERLGIVLGVIASTSLVYQLIINMFGISLMPLGGFFQRQLIWLVPCVATLALGGLASLWTRSSSGGLAVVSGVWIIQLLLRGWFARKPVWRNFLLFFGAMDPLGKDRILNQISLTALSVLALVGIYYLLIKQERYL